MGTYLRDENSSKQSQAGLDMIYWLIDNAQISGPTDDHGPLDIINNIPREYKVVIATRRFKRPKNARWRI